MFNVESSVYNMYNISKYLLENVMNAVFLKRIIIFTFLSILVVSSCQKQPFFTEDELLSDNLPVDLNLTSDITTNDAAPDEADENQSSSDTTKDNPVSLDENALNEYKGVLQNDVEFFNTDESKYMTLNQFIDSYFAMGSTNEIAEFALADFDNDGMLEIILADRVNALDNFGFVVLHYEESIMYGYRVFYRSLNHLKTDGSFHFSNSASNSGYGRLIFEGVEYRIDKLAHYENIHLTEKQLAYYINGNKATEEEYETFENTQEAKPDIVWYDFTPEGIGIAFSSSQ